MNKTKKCKKKIAISVDSIISSLLKSSRERYFQHIMLANGNYLISVSMLTEVNFRSCKNRMLVKAKLLCNCEAP